MSKPDEPKRRPGQVPGPVRIKPNKKSDLTDFRRAKRLQDYLNAMAAKARVHRLVSTEAAPMGTTCGSWNPGDTLAAHPFPLTCPDCQKHSDR